MFDIRLDDLTHPATQDLLAFHLRAVHAESPPGLSFALDLSGLLAPEVTVWTAWSADRIAGIAALRNFGNGTGELKSMRTAPDFLRQGVAAALLAHIIRESRARGMTRLSLETGSGPAFEPALALYRRTGFVDGPPFSGYTSRLASHDSLCGRAELAVACRAKEVRRHERRDDGQEKRERDGWAVHPTPRA